MRSESFSASRGAGAGVKHARLNALGLEGWAAYAVTTQKVSAGEYGREVEIESRFHLKRRLP